MSQKIHFRRCHVCGELNEASGQLVHRCSHCGKALAPFFYFDESRLLGLTSTPPAQETPSRLPLKEYPPLWGLTVYWEPTNESGPG